MSPFKILYPTEIFCYGYSTGRSTLALADHHTFLGNGRLTPPLSQHFALNEKQVLMLAWGRGMWVVSQKGIMIRFGNVSCDGC